MGGIAQLVER